MADDKNSLKDNSENLRSRGDMTPRNAFSVAVVSLDEVLSCLTKTQRERLIVGYDMRCFAKVFEHADLMKMIDCFFENGMNVLKTARLMYMHRNTLIYRLNKIKKNCGLDLRNFEMAITFQILRILYSKK